MWRSDTIGPSPGTFGSRHERAGRAMTQHYLAGELTLRLARLQAVAADQALGRDLAHLRHEAETGPPRSPAPRAAPFPPRDADARGGNGAARGAGLRGGPRIGTGRRSVLGLADTGR